MKKSNHKKHVGAVITKVVDPEKCTQVHIVLQGKTESFSDYEERLNLALQAFPKGSFVFPSASADGRLCCVINWDGKT